jgi:hypothetical protein
MNEEREPARTKDQYPFRVFLSHKVSGHGDAAIAIKRKLENYCGDKLHIFASPALSPGTAWNPQLLEEIESADLFVMLYLVQGFEMNWSLYEAGYFEREALKSGRRLICVTNPGSDLPGPLETRQHLDADDSGIERLLKAILADEEKPVRPDLLNRDNSETLNELIEFILAQLGPVKRTALTPRVWITLSGADHMATLEADSLPDDTRLEGESEALREFGVGPGAGVTLKEFYDISDFKLALHYYLPHVASALKRVIDKRREPWPIPPVRLTQDGGAKILVPAYVEKGQGNVYKFEFLVYQPDAGRRAERSSPFTTLCHLFVLGWQFRERIIERCHEELMDLLSLGANATEYDVRRKIHRFQLEMGAILLGAFNRGLEAPRKILRQFPNQSQRDVLGEIMGDDGLWTQQMKVVEAAVATNDLEVLVEALKRLKDMNKTILVLTLDRLGELAREMAGETIQFQEA